MKREVYRLEYSDGDYDTIDNKDILDAINSGFIMAEDYIVENYIDMFNTEDVPDINNKVVWDMLSSDSPSAVFLYNFFYREGLLDGSAHYAAINLVAENIDDPYDTTIAPMRLIRFNSNGEEEMSIDIDNYIFHHYLDDPSSR